MAINNEELDALEGIVVLEIKSVIAHVNVHALTQRLGLPNEVDARRAVAASFASALRLDGWKVRLYGVEVEDLVQESGEYPDAERRVLED